MDLRLKPNFQWALAKLSFVESAEYAFPQAGFLADLDTSDTQPSPFDKLRAVPEGLNFANSWFSRRLSRLGESWAFFLFRGAA